MNPNPMIQKRLDDIEDEERRMGQEHAVESFARCYRCLSQVPVVGKRYCEKCLLLPPVVLRIQTWNGFWGTPNPKPWKMLRVPYDKGGVWEEWIEPEYWTPPTKWQAWWNKQKMALGRITWTWRRLTQQPGWDDERPD